MTEEHTRAHTSMDNIIIKHNDASGTIYCWQRHKKLHKHEFKFNPDDRKNKKLSYCLEMASAIHFFVAKSLSIAVMTYTYILHVRNLHPMNRLIYHAYSERFQLLHAKTHVTAVCALIALMRDPTVV